MKEGENRDYWNHYFVVQVSKPRQWVRWGYAVKGEKVKPMHIAPAKSTVIVENFSLDFPFELGKGFECDGVMHEVREADRVTSWGWRFVSAEGVTSGSWELAGSMEKCLERAKKYFKREGLIPDGITIVDEDGGREDLGLSEDWMEFQAEAIEAVGSWMSGKGWPKGWKGCSGKDLITGRKESDS